MLHRQLHGDATAHAVTDKIGHLDAECFQECRGVGRQLLVGQRSVNISGMTVALQFDRDDLAGGREGRQ